MAGDKKMKFILMIIYILAWVIGGIELGNTGNYSNAFFAFYGAFGLALYQVLNEYKIVA
jgi:hypothetical protein